ncbi:hypothetical protein BDV25DRAFT_162655 [Aspergillus avenaceus]|uniref:F-box domain-containing protein n=1 Tax=Aspergillus avenaceus TaxID=36643 RepID=A0A5N6TJV6_ASPAV|nr:hypothetical protein BDV25DRAFT_162655 [Aspergillus avenaceus]
MMLPQRSPFESLPNELLDEIIVNLWTTPPSVSRVNQPPSASIARSTSRDLKNLARSCSRLLAAVRPRLFAHVCLDLQDVDELLSYIETWDLARYVTTLVVRGRDSPENREDPYWWRQVLARINPQRITVVAPPSFIGKMMGTQIFEGHTWAFDVPLQTLQLNQDSRTDAPLTSLDKCSCLLEARTWSSLLFNESSSLRAYSHYEYFLFQVPSLFSTWGSLAYVRPRPQKFSLTAALNQLTSFRYTAVFPFYNHVKLVLNAVELMKNLRSLSIQLSPCKGDKATEVEQKSSMDPSDPWMEITTGYSIIAHSVRDLGNRGNLVEFTACDYAFDNLRPELSSILSEILGHSDWVHDGNGTWTKKKKKATRYTPVEIVL